MATADVEIIRKAHAFAQNYHKNQKRKSGEPYITHLENVAIILAQLNQQRTTVSGQFIT